MFKISPRFALRLFSSAMITLLTFAHASLQAASWGAIKIAGQEIRGLRAALPEALPLVVSGRAVTLLAKPIASVRTAADFSSVMTAMRELAVIQSASVGRVGLPGEPARA